MVRSELRYNRLGGFWSLFGGYVEVWWGEGFTRYKATVLETWTPHWLHSLYTRLYGLEGLYVAGFVLNTFLFSELVC